MIDNARLDELPAIKMVRTIVAVDPATTSGEYSDETGIVVVAKGIDNHGYVLADISCKATPDGWARIAVKAYHDYGADRIVTEKNQGGDAWETIFRTIDPNIAFKGVNAKQGKKIRAEPVAALYEQGKMHHIGVFEKLEDQWTTWIPDLQAHQESPDRLDAAVHAVTELGLIGLPSGHPMAVLEREHLSCRHCSTPAPRGTPICPKCGQLRDDPTPVEEVEEWSVSSYGKSSIRPNPHTTAVMDFLKETQGPGKWWRR